MTKTAWLIPTDHTEARIRPTALTIHTELQPYRQDSRTIHTAKGWHLPLKAGIFKLNTSASAQNAAVLSERERRFVESRRSPPRHAERGGMPHVVPVCFALIGDTLYITIDEKPKRGTGR